MEREISQRNNPVTVTSVVRSDLNNSVSDRDIDTDIQRYRAPPRSEPKIMLEMILVIQAVQLRFGMAKCEAQLIYYKYILWDAHPKA